MPDPTPPPKASTPGTPDFSPEAIAALREALEDRSDPYAWRDSPVDPADIVQLLAALEAAEKERDALLAEREEARRTAARIADAQPPPEAIVIASAAAERAYDAALATFRAEQPTSGDEDD